ncbi:MAG: competence/damage-inducible protein A, partial [Rhodobacteraceae bacterium]|nr:competence/damage-inducible protein A [Paracoccaceae bacterium]
GGAPLLSATVRAGLPEGELAAALADLAAAFPDVGIGCYPFNFGDRPGANLVARSADPDRLAAAEAALAALVADLEAGRG